MAITYACNQILTALTRLPIQSGAQIANATGLSPAALYPALQALESSGRITGEWENTPPPRRRLYRLMIARQ